MNESTLKQETYLGEIKTKIVGMQYVQGDIRPGEEIHLERDCDNSHDLNTIRVKNADFESAGFLPRELCRWLAPLIDQGKIFVEGSLPKASKRKWISRHQGHALLLKVYLSKESSILQPNPNPSTDIEALQEVIRIAYENLFSYTNPGVIRGLEKRLQRAVRRDVLPETHLLLSLFPAKDKEMRKHQSQSVLEKVRNRLGELKLGDAIHHQNLTIFPLLKTNGSKADYVLLKTALESNVVEVEETSEEGSVHELLLHNRGDKPVLIPEGEILSGAKQNRVINITILVAAHATIRVPVSCVERGRWRFTSRHFESTHYAHPKLRGKKMKSVMECRAQFGEARSDQGEVWDEVEEHLSDLDACSPTDSVTDGYKNSEKRIKSYREKFSLPEKTAGVLVCSGNEIVGMDCYDSPEIFKQCWERLADSYFMEAISDSLNKPTTPKQNAEEFLDHAKRPIELCDPSLGLGNELMIKTGELSGTGVWYDDSLCHFSVFSVE